MTPNTILDFWFNELTPKQWFIKDDTVDALIQQRFLETYQQAAQGELYSWRQTPQGRLAEIIILDQFPRNMFRGSAQSFATDPMALVLAQEAVAQNDHEKVETTQKAFMLMPYMHSESVLIHKEAVKLFSAPGLENNLDFEGKHKVIIDRFGRYPHRNEILGRKSTPEEIEFLKDNPGF
jgi:uncharacterized protein (DUF924 family)